MANPNNIPPYAFTAYIEQQKKRMMATKTKTKKPAAPVKKPKPKSGKSDSQKIRDAYDAHIKELGFRDTQNKIIKSGFKRNTVVPVIWRHRISIGEIPAPDKTKTKKPAAPVKKSPAKKSPAKKSPAKKSKPKKSAPIVE